MYKGVEPRWENRESRTNYVPMDARTDKNPGLSHFFCLGQPVYGQGMVEVRKWTRVETVQIWLTQKIFSFDAAETNGHVS